MNKEIIEKLCNFGFSEKEATIYVVLLEYGTSIASTIARKTGFNRTSVYTMLNDMILRWLVSEFIQNDIKYYSAVNPDNILNNLENRASMFKDMLPSLFALDSKYGNKPKIKYYEWLTWIKSAYYEVLNAWYHMEEPFLSIYWINENIDENVVKFFNEEFVKERKKCPLKSLVITTSKTMKEDHFDIQKDKKSYESIEISHPTMDIADDIMIYDSNKIALFSYSKGELSAMIIESRSLYNTFRSLFYFIWDNYKK